VKTLPFLFCIPEDILKTVASVTATRRDTRTIARIIQ
tara:strand:- start:1922 stop:2032 length:111 start_codon:yes stop_codon:yes gene_type:complete